METTLCSKRLYLAYLVKLVLDLDYTDGNHKCLALIASCIELLLKVLLRVHHTVKYSQPSSCNNVLVGDSVLCPFQDFFSS